MRLFWTFIEQKKHFGHPLPPSLASVYCPRAHLCCPVTGCGSSGFYLSPYGEPVASVDTLPSALLLNALLYYHHQIGEHSRSWSWWRSMMQMKMKIKMHMQMQMQTRLVATNESLDGRRRASPEPKYGAAHRQLKPSMSRRF